MTHDWHAPKIEPFDMGTEVDSDKWSSILRISDTMGLSPENASAIIGEGTDTFVAYPGTDSGEFGEPCGIVVARVRPDEYTSELLGIVVAPEHRGEGISSFLINAVRKAAGCKHTLHVSLPPEHYEQTQFFENHNVSVTFVPPKV